MRRTYRSKKEAASGIERRDLFQNLDEKSSAYDAFSIQNIKQTKRELSCVTSSNPLGVASNRVRRKKYVKRIIKDARTPRRDTSESAYLTPDKSIRVNKPLDPFDLLLMSSPACPEPEEKKLETVTSKVDMFDQIVPKKEGRTYTRRKTKLAKKFNSNTESSDSDKENSGDRLNITQDTSDIRTHKLLVEHKIKTPCRKIDESINNIVNNLSLLNKLKNNCYRDDSFNKSIILNRHRLTRNIQSPLLQKSPLCSTPFKVKYRGESIFKFSPIATTNEDNSPKYTTVMEYNDSSNSSKVLLDINKVESPKDIEEKCFTSMNSVPVDNNESDEIPQSKIEADARDNKEKANDVMKNETEMSNAILSSEISSLQTTEIEPFLGFSHNTIDEVIAKSKNQAVRLSYLDDSMPKNDTEVVEKHTDIVEGKLDDTEQKNDVTQLEFGDDNHCFRANGKGELDDMVQRNDISQLEYGNDSHYSKENVDDGSDLKQISVNSYTGQENDTTQQECAGNSEHPGENNNISAEVSEKDDNASLSLQSEGDKDSLYDTCTSEQSSILEKEDDQIEDVKEPVVVLQRMNDSLFSTYYNKMQFQDNESDKETSLNSDFASFRDSNDSTQSSEDVSEVETNNKTSENETDDCNEIGSNDEKSSSNNEEEQCISFVTTRRRNDATNNSILSIFNESCNSSTTDCDKTVLSNNNKLEKADLKNDIDDTLIYSESYTKCKDIDESIDLNKDSEQSDDPTDGNDTRLSFVTTRNSNITDRKSSIRARNSSLNPRNSIILTGNAKLARMTTQNPETSRMSCVDSKPGIVLQPGKKWERSLSIYRRMTVMADHFDESILDEMCTETKGRKYRQSIINTMEMQDFNSSLHNDSINSRRSTFACKPSRSTIRIVKDPNRSRLSLCNTTVFDDLTGFLNEECDDTIIELSKLSIADQTHEVTVLDTFHDTPNRIATPRDYVLRRCNQTDPILFDECYPDTVLKNCHKIGEGVYGEVFLWRDRDGRARVLKIVPIAGTVKVNGESQKDFHEIISEIVIAMELSALRAPIADIERHFDEGKDVEALDLHAIENATDVFNEVLAVRCVYGSYPSRLLDLWDLYDECKGSENDNPAILPLDQQFIVLELANAGQDLESYQFNNAEQAHALFLQVAYGLAVAEEAFQFEHRDLHWGNVLIAPTEQKYATFVIRGRAHRVLRMGVRATVIDYSLSRLSLRLAAGDDAALYNDLAHDDSLFDAVGDYQFQVYRLMRDKLGNDWKNFEPYTNILWLHYTVDKMITALRYKRTNTKIHKHYIDKLKGIKSRILDYGSAAQFVLTDNEI